MPHILLAEDEALIREVFAQYLSRAGHRVTQARDGAHALELVQDDPVDIIVTDFKMPRMNGADFLRAARRLHPGTPALVISAYGYEVGRLDSLGDGETRLCAKPINPRMLCQEVEQLIPRDPAPEDTADLS